MSTWHKAAIERVADTQFFIRPNLIRSLKSFSINDAGRKFFGHNYQTGYDEWKGTFGERFFDMGTLIRLATAIEQNLKEYYMLKKGCANRRELIESLAKNEKYRKNLNVFQQIMPWQGRGALELYREELALELSDVPKLASMQELMLHRHLYAHNSGLIDDKYIERLKNLTGRDLMQDPRVIDTYPDEDLYWFEPLGRLSQFVEDARAFFRSFPEPVNK